MAENTLASYRLVEKLGEGGMGAVWRAIDTTLDREVAVKILSEDYSQDSERLGRFKREAKAIAALNHPNIVTVYSVEEADGVHFITMELIRGATLSKSVPKGGLDLDTFFSLAISLTEAIDAAHGKGITHRDLKPDNVMIGEDGRLRVLDFGLAKLKEEPPAGVEGSQLPTATVTQEGKILGTVPYMSPEQIEGRHVDHRSDIFSLGVMLYQMVTGARPFVGDTSVSIISSIIKDEPVPVRTLRRSLPSKLGRVIARCLEKRAERRTQTVAELHEDLEYLRRCSKSRLRLLCRPRILLPAGLAVAVIVSLSVVDLLYRERSRWAEEEAVPEIERLIEKERFVAAFDLASLAADYAGSDAIPGELWDRMSHAVSITTEPAGAELLWKEYGDVEGEWRSLGTVDEARLPLGFLRWQARMEGQVPLELASSASDGELSFHLLPDDHADSGMVRVPESTVDLELVAGLRTSPVVELNGFLIDRCEVTNGEFMGFVEAGGYERPELWKHRFQDGDVELSFDEAMSRFVDATGMRGPATWELGSYPEGSSGHPVTGVSWYEAAAYAEFVEKELPTIFHWHAAADTETTASHLLPLANFASSGPREAGLSHVLGSFGTYDMAGNVKEWCHNATDGHRFILGGSWNDPSYMYWLPEHRPAFDRSPESGFRCMKQIGGGSAPEQALADISLPALRDYSTEEPAADDFFRVYLKFFDYDRVPLEAVTEFVDDSSRFWTREAVSFSAGYGDERLTAYLFLPKSSKPPYQTMILFPGAGAFSRTTSLAVDDLHSWYAVDFIIKSGRAVLYPVWKGTHERRDGFRIRASIASFREHSIQWSKELRQAVDLLESRADVDSGRIGYCGSSFGSVYGPMLMALEERIRVGVLWLGGLPTQEMPPEIDPLNYAPRVTVPVLMINGRYDNLFPVEMSQEPLYRFLGTAEEDKRHILLDVGHSIPRPRQEAIREVLDWLDRYLGPVN